ncbi:hypothetical protein DEAC_c40050 [Desulfosporosinus acididurans]|uniref:DUF2577 domain-containing protein n=1 Tax=Desulfosporosinus acididurans TaxID=476652 RepID=A0A0J1IH77_9FIRM|nr:DUF2577 domain-containing protein [Desulfosporosinus acididurans]KLU64011.1 hypothetical protein DEAC_c40050 [Desulfosporosinus acididurans]
MRPKNPYSQLVKIMQDHGAKYNPPSVELATVISRSPLTVLAGELQLGKDNLLVADYLISGYSREATFSNTSGALSFTDSLNVGDTLAVVQVNDSTYIILARVVSA